MSNNQCPPHSWLLPRETEGVILAKCMRPGCNARQFQPCDASRETIRNANELNKRHHYPLLQVTSRRRPVVWLKPK